MAAADGRENGGLSDRLFKEPYAFDFFQAVRILQRLAMEQGGAEPRRHAPVGQDSAPEQEAIRFRSQPSLSFPPSPIAQVRPLPGAANGAVPTSFAEMVVTFMGVTGPLGVLPYHYTALLLRRIREKDFSLRNFLDLFHHRAISLFYRAWTKYRLPQSYEHARLDDSGKREPITWGLYCLIGMGTEGLRGRLSIDDEALLYYSGHFSHGPRSAVVLQGMLTDYFGMPIEVLQLQGQWLRLDSDQQAKMPNRAGRAGLNHQLGTDVIVGERVWDLQSKFRLRVGPVTYPQFQDLMPTGTALLRLRQLTRAFVGPEFDFDVQVLLRRDEVPQARLGGLRSRLGWDMWARAREFIVDADDAVFEREENLPRNGESP